MFGPHIIIIISHDLCKIYWTVDDDLDTGTYLTTLAHVATWMDQD